MRWGRTSRKPTGTAPSTGAHVDAYSPAKQVVTMQNNLDVSPPISVPYSRRCGPVEGGPDPVETVQGREKGGEGKNCRPCCLMLYSDGGTNCRHSWEYERLKFTVCMCVCLIVECVGFWLWFWMCLCLTYPSVHRERKSYIPRGPSLNWFHTYFVSHLHYFVAEWRFPLVVLDTIAYFPVLSSGFVVPLEVK